MPSKPKKANKSHEPTIYEIQEVAFEATEYASRLAGWNQQQSSGGISSVSTRSKRGREDLVGSSSVSNGEETDVGPSLAAMGSDYAPQGLLKFSKAITQLNPAAITSANPATPSPLSLAFPVSGPQMLIKQVIALVHEVEVGGKGGERPTADRGMRKKALVEWSNGTVGWTFDVANLLDEHRCLQRYKLVQRLAPNPFAVALLLATSRKQQTGGGIAFGGAIQRLCRTQLSRWIFNEFARWGKTAAAGGRRKQEDSGKIQQQEWKLCRPSIVDPTTVITMINKITGKRTVKELPDTSGGAGSSSGTKVPSDALVFPIQVQDASVLVYPKCSNLTIGGGANDNSSHSSSSLALNVQFYAGLSSDPWSIKIMTLTQIMRLTRTALGDRRKTIAEVGKRNVKCVASTSRPLQRVFYKCFKSSLAKAHNHVVVSDQVTLDVLRMHLSRSITAAIRRAVLTRTCLAIRLVKLMKGVAGSSSSGGGGGLAESQRRMGVASESDLLFLSILQWYEEQDSPELMLEWASVNGLLPLEGKQKRQHSTAKVTEQDFLRPLMMDSDMYLERERLAQKAATSAFLADVERACTEQGLLEELHAASSEDTKLLSTLTQLLVVTHDFPITKEDLPSYFCHVGPEDIVWSVEIPNLLANKTELGIPSSTAPQSGRVSSIISSLPTFDVRGTKDPGVAGVGLGPLGVKLNNKYASDSVSTGGVNGASGGATANVGGVTTRGTKKGSMTSAGSAASISSGTAGSGVAGTSLLDQIGGMGVALKPGADRAIKVPAGKPLKQDVGMLEAIKSVRSFLNEHGRTPTVDELYSVRQWM